MTFIERFRRFLGFRDIPDKAQDACSNATDLRAREHTDSDTGHRRLYLDAIEYCKHGNYDTGICMLQQAIELKHDFAEAHLMLGQIYYQQGRLQDATDCFLLAVCFHPGLANAHYNLGALALRRGATDEAHQCFSKAIDADPECAMAHMSLGKVFLDRGDFDAAYEHFKRVVEIDPQNAVAHSNLGYILLKGYYRANDALRSLEVALRLDPSLADAHCNQGMVLQYLARCEEAISACDRALDLAPGLTPARVTRSLALLMTGDYGKGWQEYEERAILNPAAQRPIPYPKWRGDSLTGRTVLVCAEQGLGDEIMFASCLPDIIAQAGHCVVECNRKLEKLFARSFPSATVVGGSQLTTDLSWLKRVPPIDCKIAIGSLPFHFRTSLRDFPRHDGYLKADPQRVSFWRKRLSEMGAGPKIGLSWRGGSRGSNQSFRSLSLVDLLPLLRLPGMHFISLQYTECVAEITAMREQHGVSVRHWQEAIDDYDETAALVAALDMIISVQTAVVHLSGALNKPVWAMVPATPEWRYQRAGETVPWYPSLRIFRQHTLGDWQPVIDRIITELQPEPEAETYLHKTPSA